MIHLNKLRSSKPGEKIACEHIAEALPHFDRELLFLVARYDTDEEWLGLNLAIDDLNARRVAGANLAGAGSCQVWNAREVHPDGPGWRVYWVQNVLQSQPQAAAPVGRLIGK